MSKYIINQIRKVFYIQRLVIVYHWYSFFNPKIKKAYWKTIPKEYGKPSPPLKFYNIQDATEAFQEYDQDPPTITNDESACIPYEVVEDGNQFYIKELINDRWEYLMIEYGDYRYSLVEKWSFSSRQTVDTILDYLHKLKY